MQYVESKRMCARKYDPTPQKKIGQKYTCRELEIEKYVQLKIKGSKQHQYFIPFLPSPPSLQDPPTSTAPLQWIYQFHR